MGIAMRVTRITVELGVLLDKVNDDRFAQHTQTETGSFALRRIGLSTYPARRLASFATTAIVMLVPIRAGEELAW